MSCSRRGPLRYVCGQTVHPTAMIDAFLESPTYLDVLPGTRFALFGRNRRNWCRRSRHKKQRNLLFAAEIFTLQLRFPHLLYLFSFCWHTGDNVRLSDVVKFSPGLAQFCPIFAQVAQFVRVSSCFFPGLILFCLALALLCPDLIRFHPDLTRFTYMDTVKY